MYTLYVGNKNYSSWSLRPWLVIKHLNVPFEEVVTPFSEGSNWDDFRRFSPTGLVPCLVDGEQVVWDSLGITEYLADRHDGVWPSDAKAKAWARCATAEMHAGFNALRDICSMNIGVRIKLNEVPARLQKDIDRIDELWQQGLKEFSGPFLAGDAFTAVDAFFAPVVYRIRTFGLKLSDDVMAYVDRMLNHPLMLEWEKAGLAESWREPGHEEDALKYGVLISDERHG